MSLKNTHAAKCLRGTCCYSKVKKDMKTTSTRISRRVAKAALHASR